MKGLILIAAVVVVGMLTLLTAAFVLNAWGIVSGRFDYPFPGEIIGLCQLVLGAAISVLTLGGIAAMRAAREEDECITPVSIDGKVLIEPALIEKAKDSAEIVTVTAEKFDERTDLDNLYPGIWDGQISIMEVNDNADDNKKQPSDTGSSGGPGA